MIVADKGPSDVKYITKVRISEGTIEYIIYGNKNVIDISKYATKSVVDKSGVHIK